RRRRAPSSRRAWTRAARRRRRSPPATVAGAPRGRPHHARSGRRAREARRARAARARARASQPVEPRLEQALQQSRPLRLEAFGPGRARARGLGAVQEVLDAARGAARECQRAGLGLDLDLGDVGGPLEATAHGATGGLAQEAAPDRERDAGRGEAEGAWL